MPPLGKRRIPRLTLVISAAAAASLLLAGCSEPKGSGDVDSLDVIDFQVTDDGSPEANIDGEIEAQETSARVLEEGDGETVNNGELALVNTAIVDPTSGEITAENFTSSSEAIPVGEQLQQTDETLFTLLSENPIGSQVAYYVTAAGEGQQVSPGTSQLMIVELVGKGGNQAQGEEVPADQLNDALPSVTRDEETGEPTVEAPEGDPPEDLVTDVLVQGEGEAVEENDYVTVQYRGISWSDGSEFDSSWSRDQPTGFELQQVVEGWRQGLTGQQVGSQVVISVPPELGYGDQEEHELSDETLVFVVDILHTAHPIPPEEPTEDPSAEPTTEEN